MEPYLGEIQPFAFSYAPYNWMPCDGRLLQVQSNASLFALIGTQFGGDGSTTFALPNLIGRVSVNQGHGPGLPAYAVGDIVGSASVTVTADQMPRHVHSLQLGIKTSTGGKNRPAVGAAMMDPDFNGFVAPPAGTTLAPESISYVGGSQAHANNQPTVAVMWCICVAGNYPSFG